ncbi:DUF7341 domain-containing protein [Nocardia farcinica]|uniref:Uncharacterized protein n=1 Tax=Nocardia farcinica (strain IFM 10152) TaxID=247156 RepID=Q5YSN0_NOCFA|nr:hypothetical protein [Nocardia farcinica]BAD58811.1 hypothetical protein NFA_39630 [Nocardia farcinica IFM 10152]
MSEPTELVEGARAAFADAVHDLIGWRSDTIERDDGPETVVRSSLYSDLTDARLGETYGYSSRRPTPASRGPGWSEALSLLVQIDQRVAQWWPGVPDNQHGQPLTVRRLYALCDHGWRPQDVAVLRRMARVVRSWVGQAEALLGEDAAAHRYELRAACPACGALHVWGEDAAGETVRRYSLVVDRSSAQCLACDTRWAPEYYAILARTIGAGLPDGVLE